MVCNGCNRTAEWNVFSSTAEEPAFSRYESSIKLNVIEALTTECFRFRCLDWDIEPNAKPAEYLVDIDYDEELYDDWLKPDGQKVHKSSKLTVTLYYNGTSGSEQVQQWITEKPPREYGDLRPESLPGPDSGLRNVLNKMCNNPSAILKKLRPIELTLLNAFEKQPRQCDVELSEDELCPGDETQVTITNIQDIEGAKSREFNRIVVYALEGKIIGGTPVDMGPEYRAFLVKDGTINFKYKAPTGGGVPNDKIYVYNSCDIARSDQYPLSETLTRDKIEEAKVEIKDCYEAIAEVKGRELVTEVGERAVTIGDGTSKDSRDYRSEVEASFHLMLEQTMTLPMRMHNEYYEYYKVIKIFLASFRATLNDREYSYISDSKSWSDETNTWTGRGTNPRIPEPLKRLLEMGQIICVFDDETKKAKAVLLPVPIVDYDFTRNLFQEVNGDGPSGERHSTHEDTRHEQKDLTLGPVNKSNHSSSTSLQHSPDCMVTSGDGENFMAGSGKITTDKCSHNNKDYTTCKTERTYSWKFTKIEKIK
jgi:hypothetical protein